MKAVYSFWNTTGNPLVTALHWLNPKFQLYSIVLSVHYAKKWYDQVQLVTDSDSVAIFQQLNLPFTAVSTALDEINDYDRKFWALGKIKAYSMQTEPFIHIDNDAILFKPLNLEIQEKPIFVQNFERFSDIKIRDNYKHQIEFLLQKGIVKSWFATEPYAVNMGIYGCNDMVFNQKYCQEVFEFMDDNADLILRTGTAHKYSIIFEQYLLAGLAKNENVVISALSEPYSPEELGASGYTHILSSKGDHNLFLLLEKRVREEFPEHYRIISNLIF